MTALEMRNAYWNHYGRVVIGTGIRSAESMAARRLYLWANERYYQQERSKHGA